MADVVNVRLPRRLYKSLGRKDWPITLNGERTLEWVLRRLAAECHPGFNELLVEGATRPRWLETIMLNGRSVVLPRDLQVLVKGGDRLYFFELIAGG